MAQTHMTASLGDSGSDSGSDSGQASDGLVIARHLDGNRLTALKEVVSTGDFEVLVQACLEDAIRRGDLITSADELPEDPRDCLIFLQSQAHDLKSSSGQIGATVLHGLAMSLEHMCKSALHDNAYDPHEVEVLQSQIADEVRLVADLMQQTHGIACNVQAKVLD